MITSDLRRPGNRSCNVVLSCVSRTLCGTGGVRRRCVSVCAVSVSCMSPAQQWGRVCWRGEPEGETYSNKLWANARNSTRFGSKCAKSRCRGKCAKLLSRARLYYPPMRARCAALATDRVTGTALCGKRTLGRTAPDRTVPACRAAHTPHQPPATP